MRKQSSASDLLAYLRLAVAPADDAAMLTALAIPARGFGAGGVAVKYLKQAAAQRGGVGALLAAAQVRCLCKPHSSFPFCNRGTTLWAQAVWPRVPRRSRGAATRRSRAGLS